MRGLLPALAFLLPLTTLAAPWPAADASLRVVQVPEIAGEFRPIRLALDPGHGAPGNTGNRDVRCRHEADHMRAVAEGVASRLGSDRRFVVKLLREGEATPRYPTRVAKAAAFRAEVIVSLHSDARGSVEWWHPAPANPDLACLRNDAAPGIGVLLSDEGSTALVEKRLRVARGLARRFEEAGLPRYLGAEYATLYRLDAEPGVFIDARPKRQRVYMLRQRLVPAVIVETHHALDLEENARWQEPRTLDAFAAALAAGLVEALRPSASK